MIELLILSFIQGVTEFLPVSSSSHLIIFSKFSDFAAQSLSIDVSLHIGSLIAVLTYFHKEIFNFLKNLKLFIKIFVASIPIIIFGFFLVQTNLIQELRNLKIVGWATLIFGIFLYYSDKFNLKYNVKNDFTFRTAIIVGLFQIFALIPGVSRSGITITAARLLKFKRVDAAKISFLLSIPTLGAVSIFGLKNIFYSDNLSFSILNLTSIFLSFIFSYLTIKYFLKYINKFSLDLFVFYRVFLGVTLLIIAYS
tara:strand:- start:1535 stop:2293 length:759 start_codon:yes stop_codon:yes gene_type:complete